MQFSISLEVASTKIGGVDLSSDPTITKVGLFIKFRKSSALHDFRKIFKITFK